MLTINEILNIEPIIKNTGKIILDKLESIEFQNVYFRYEGAKQDMLKNICFRIEKGENVGIIGSSGSGKTTIINLLLRHIDATKGNILINGINIKDIELPEKLALVIGNEGNGISSLVRDKCDKFIYIDMNNKCESLNAGVAASILMYEVNKK